MSKTKPEQPPEQSSPVVLSVNCIVNGVFIPAGAATPYLRVEDLPENLKGSVAVGDEDFYHPSERNIYGGHKPELGEPTTLYQFTGSQARSLRRQAGQLSAGLQEQIYAEQEAEAASKLSPEVEEVLQSEHDKFVGLVRAQLQFNRDAADRIYEEAERVSEPQKLFVRRGAVYTDVKKVTPRPAEHVFVRRASGTYESIGIVNAEGTLPPEEIIP